MRRALGCVHIRQQLAHLGGVPELEPRDLLSPLEPAGRFGRGSVEILLGEPRLSFRAFEGQDVKPQTFVQELDVGRLVAPLASVLTYRHDLQAELMDVRRILEPAVARVAAARMTDDDLAALERILDTQRRKRKSGQSAILEDTAFHAVLARATRNRVLVSIMATLNDLLVESRTLTLKQKGRPERSIKGHEAVIAALRRRDEDDAARAMLEHIDQIAVLLEEGKS